MHAFYHKLDKTVDPPLIEANAKVQIIRTFTGYNRVRDKGKEGLNFGKMS